MNTPSIRTDKALIKLSDNGKQETFMDSSSSSSLSREFQRGGDLEVIGIVYEDLLRGREGRALVELAASAATAGALPFGGHLLFSFPETRHSVSRGYHGGIPIVLVPPYLLVALVSIALACRLALRSGSSRPASHQRRHRRRRGLGEAQSRHHRRPQHRRRMSIRIKASSV